MEIVTAWFSSRAGKIRTAGGSSRPLAGGSVVRIPVRTRGPAGKFGNGINIIRPKEFQSGRPGLQAQQVDFRTRPELGQTEQGKLYMRRGQEQRDSCKSACLLVMNEKDPSGREWNVWATGKSRSWPSEKGRALLTNQCLGKERMLSEELRNQPFLTVQTYSRETMGDSRSSERQRFSPTGTVSAPPTDHLTTHFESRSKILGMSK